MIGRTIRRWGAVAICLALCLFAVATLHTSQRGRQAMLDSDRAFHQGRLTESVHYARRAALLYVPGAGHVEAAYERLFAIARGAEVARDKETAAMAWRAVRAAATGTSHGWVPMAERRTEAVQALRRLNEAVPVAGTIPGRTSEGVRAGMLACSFLLALAACVGVVLTAMSPSGSWNGRRAIVPAVVAGVSGVLWGVSLIVT